MAAVLGKDQMAHGLGNSREDIAAFEHVRRLHIGRYLGAAAILALLVWIGISFARGQIEWRVVGQFLLAKTILAGVLNTVWMAVLAMLLGVTIGILVALMRLSSNPVLRSTALGYIWFFRATPSLLQLLLWFNLALIFPTLGIPGLIEYRTIDVVTPFSAALIGLGIAQGAYTSEVVRAGFLSVESGQYEAAAAIGMPRLMALRRIVLPQAMRVIVPPIGNEFIGMVKWTAIASVIQYEEVLYAAQNIYYANHHVIELLIVAAVWYLVVVSVLSVIQDRIERHYSRGARGIHASR
ncbi:ABC transporter permease [Bradyrhizobium yuanmingense]|uniref:Glutamate/aspartate import permease protein GltK n=1 Tax=Bradyrhizobium yuanmingense TaxID=108015 RepID=A0A0R3CUP7_9BRAD|nr:amino acid ABC transporter permease [Bradyrhizobium yuanmingense]KRP98753.1 ABC transporter permease [Bradyrhizobium yuanmingense]